MPRGAVCCKILIDSDCQLSQRTGVSNRSLSAFVQLFSSPPGAWSPLGLNFVSMDTKKWEWINKLVTGIKRCNEC